MNKERTLLFIWFCHRKTGQVADLFHRSPLGQVIKASVSLMATWACPFDGLNPYQRWEISVQEDFEMVGNQR